MPNISSTYQLNICLFSCHQPIMSAAEVAVDDSVVIAAEAAEAELMKTPVVRGEIKRLPPSDPPSASLLSDSFMPSHSAAVTCASSQRRLGEREKKKTMVNYGCMVDVQMCRSKRRRRGSQQEVIMESFCA